MLRARFAVTVGQPHSQTISLLGAEFVRPVTDANEFGATALRGCLSEFVIRHVEIVLRLWRAVLRRVALPLNHVVCDFTHNSLLRYPELPLQTPVALKREPRAFRFLREWLFESSAQFSQRFCVFHPYDDLGVGLLLFLREFRHTLPVLFNDVRCCWLRCWFCLVWSYHSSRVTV